MTEFWMSDAYNRGYRRMFTTLITIDNAYFTNAFFRYIRNEFSKFKNYEMWTLGVNIPDFRKKFLNDFKTLQDQFDSIYGEGDSMLTIIEKQLQLCNSYRPLIKNLQESNEVTTLINNLTTKLLVLKLTGDLKKDVAKLTNRIDDLEQKLNR